MQAASFIPNTRPTARPIQRAGARRRASVVAASHRRGEGEAQQQESLAQPASLDLGGMHEEENSWWFNNRDRALMRALATRPELPEGNVWEADDIADSAMIASWHEKAWSDLAQAE